jgi:hypothetical protein
MNPGNHAGTFSANPSFGLASNLPGTIGPFKPIEDPPFNTKCSRPGGDSSTTKEPLLHYRAAHSGRGSAALYALPIGIAGYI